MASKLVLYHTPLWWDKCPHVCAAQNLPLQLSVNNWSYDPLDKNGITQFFDKFYFAVSVKIFYCSHSIVILWSMTKTHQDCDTGTLIFKYHNGKSATVYKCYTINFKGHSHIDGAFPKILVLLFIFLCVIYFHYYHYPMFHGSSS